VKLCLLLHWWSEFVWAEGNRNGVGQKFTWAEWWAEITEMSFNTERQNSPLRSAPMLCARVIESGLRKSQPASIYIRLFTQSAVRQYNNQTVLADLLERYSVSVPLVTNNIYRSAVPAPNYLPERRSAAFWHHYSPDLALAKFWPDLVDSAKLQCRRTIYSWK